MKFSQIEKQFKEKGFGVDSIDFDLKAIESRRCPKCNRFLVYRAFSNPAAYVAFGVCAACDYARRFFGNGDFGLPISGKKDSSAAAVK